MAAVHLLLEQTRSLLAAPLAGCSAQQLARHPDGDPARWSARQVVEHLAATWQLTTNGVADRLQKGRPLKTQPSLRQRCMQVAVCRFGYFPSGRKAPGPVEPRLDDDGVEVVTGDELIARIGVLLATMDGLLNRIEPQSNGVPVLTHIVLGPLSVSGWRSFHRVHARHHVAQIRGAIGG